MPRLNFLRFFFALLLIPGIDAAALDGHFDDYSNSDNTKETADCDIEIHISNTNSVDKFKVHSQILALAPVLAAPFDDEKSPTVSYIFEREEASAFKKIIYFLYHDHPQKMEWASLEHFFAPDDLTDLILLTLKFEIKGLGEEIEKFLYLEIKKKKTAVDDTSIFLDSLTTEQLRYLHRKLSQGIKAPAPWLTNIINNLDFYYCNICLRMDPRVKGIEMNFDPNLINATASKLWKEHYHAQGRRRLEDEKNQRARQEQEFESEAEDIAYRIKTKFEKALLKAGRNGKFTEKRSYRVPTKFVHRVMNILETTLVAYKIDIPIDFKNLHRESDLHQECNPHINGLCCAQAVGWACCLALLPVQLLSCNYGGYCGMISGKENCCCGAPVNKKGECGCTIFGVAVSHCLYNAGSCNSRWITIEPKNSSDVKLPTLSGPPPESPDWV